MEPKDINRIVSVGDPQISPDGAQIAYVLTRIDEKANRYSSQVWITPTDGSAPPRALTAGEHSDASPRWLPDGRALAFTSTRRKDTEGKTKSSIFLLPMDLPGETSLLAESDEGIGSMAVSPDGTWVAYTTRTRGAHYENDDIDRRPPRRIDHMLFQLNGEGFVIDRRTTYTWSQPMVPARHGTSPQATPSTTARRGSRTADTSPWRSTTTHWIWPPTSVSSASMVSPSVC